jgi:flavin-dependent dehydrogenase
MKNIAIIGGGPAASTLAILLCRGGYNVAMYFSPEQAPVLVGESLVPMIIPMLKDLGVEQEVADYSRYKPGACFTFNADEIFSFLFSDNPSDLPSYAYNVPRKEFNVTLRNAAKKAGALLIEKKVELKGGGDEDVVQLDEASLQAATECWGSAKPDLIVDATGRVRLINKHLNIPAQDGPRKDVALFAHVDQTQLVDKGYVHNDRLDQGWGWRIPLPGKVSLGFVVPAGYAEQVGNTPEEQYDGLLQSDQVLKVIAKDSQRITKVMRFDNYQSLSSRLTGRNWVMLGDSGGFVDPVFSSGMLIAMDSAYQLADTLLKGKPMAEYEKAIKAHLEAWFEIVGYYYNGRLMTSFKVGEEFKERAVGKLMVPWITKHMSRIFSGAAATQKVSLNLLRILVRYGLRDKDPEYFSVK